MSFGAFMSLIRHNDRILDGYLIHCLRTAYAADFFVRNANTTTNISNLNLSTLAQFQIPLPPLEVQKEIVAEIEGYQKVIDGARAVLDNYRPTINRNARPVDVKQQILSALEKFKARDWHLVANKANERAMTSKISHYLQEVLPSWDVDHEYNREGDNPKQRDTGKHLIPDIIVHRRGTRANFIIIEAKKKTFPREDRQKLENAAKKFGYKYAFALTLHGSKNVTEWVDTVIEPDAEEEPSGGDWPMVELGEICEINPETINPLSMFPNQTVFYIDISSVENETGRFLGYTEVASSDAPSRARRGIRGGDVLLSTVRPNLKAFTLLKPVRNRAIASTGFAVLRARSGVAEPAYILASLCSDHAINQMVGMMGKGAYPSINQSDVAAIKIPLPPLATQQAIVAEIEAEQALVNANRDLIARFEKKIQATLARVWGEGS